MISFGQLITMATGGSRNCKKIGVFLSGFIVHMSFNTHQTIGHIIKPFDLHLLFLSIKGVFLIIIYLICIFCKRIIFGKNGQ